MEKAEIQRLMEDDKRYVWHPFTQMEEWLQGEPLIVAEGEGVLLKDLQGRTYLDGVSSLWTNVHGHRVPEMDKAVRDQLDRVAHSTLLGQGNIPSIELARELAHVTPEGLEKVFYSDSGSTAVEVALKIAFQYWQQEGAPEGKKTRFACVDNAYHGDTIGSVSVGGIDLFHSIYRPLLFDSLRLPSPHCYRCPLNLERDSCDLACADKAESVIRDHADELAAVIMEPLVQGAAGIIVHPEGYLKRVAKACRENDVLLILDEVATGFGRTGRLFACEHEEVAPDLLAMAKGLSGGYLPLAATVVSERLFKGFLGSFESLRTFFHGHTYTGNPLACAAALASLEIFRTRDLVRHVEELGAELGGMLEDLSRMPHVGHVRRRGLMAGVELVKDPATKEPFDLKQRVGHQVIMEARRRGAILRPLGDVVVIMPPLGISQDELKQVMGILEESLMAVMETL